MTSRRCPGGREVTKGETKIKRGGNLHHVSNEGKKFGGNPGIADKNGGEHLSKVTKYKSTVPFRNLSTPVNSEEKSPAPMRSTLA